MRHIITKIIILTGFVFLTSASYSKPALIDSPYLVTPTGQYGIGYKELLLKNPDLCPDAFYQNGLTDEDYTEDNTQHCHEIMLTVYYPAEGGPQPRDSYYPPVLDDFITDLKTHVDLSKQQLTKLNKLYAIQTFNAQAAKPSVGQLFPVIFFIPGAGVQSQNYNNIISGLVSHGYVVVAMNSAHIAGSIYLGNKHIVRGNQKYPEGGRLEEYSDLEYVFKNIKSFNYGKDLLSIMDFRNMGFLGHSMGAMNLIYYLQKTPDLAQIKAGVFTDPGNVLGDKNYPVEIKEYPFMIIWSSYFREHMHGSMTPKQGDKEFILTPEMQETEFSNHINFTDYSTLQYFPLLQTKQIKKSLTDPSNVYLGSGDGNLIAITINQLLLGYFDSYLKSNQN